MSNSFQNGSIGWPGIHLVVNGKAWLLMIIFLVGIAGQGWADISNASSNGLAGSVSTSTNDDFISVRQMEETRAECIQNRRIICGKILKMLPDGWVVDSGYTNLMREPLNHSWLVPGTATASRATQYVEQNRPNSVCMGLVFLIDVPASRKLKPKLYDYVVICGYPAGQRTYTSVGNIKRKVRRFSAALDQAIRMNLQSETKK